MSCQEIQHLLAEYVDGTLASTEKAQVEDHLAGCAQCAADVAELQRLVPMLRSLPDQQPPAELADEIFAVTTRRWPRFLKKRRLFRPRYAPISAAAAILVVVVAVIAVYGNLEMSPFLPKLKQAPQPQMAKLDEHKAADAQTGIASRGMDKRMAADHLEEMPVGTSALPPEVTGMIERAVKPKARRTDRNRQVAQEVAVKKKATPEMMAGEFETGIFSLAPPETVIDPDMPISSGEMRREQTEETLVPQYMADEADSVSLRSQGAGRTANERDVISQLPPTAAAVDGTVADQMVAEDEEALEDGMSEADRDVTTAELLHRWEGQHCGVNKPLTMVVTSASRWAKLWFLMNASRIGTPPTPPINFERQTVIGVFLGLKETGGHAITIQGVQTQDGKLVILVRVTQPQPGTRFTQALTQPYSVVVVPRRIDGLTIDRSTPVKVVYQ